MPEFELPLVRDYTR
uniref:Uncharacterized protein n=1 Tax=Anguilla anguilla TaxID=7936 RepID=A0A0E9QST2_ANGAN